MADTTTTQIDSAVNNYFDRNLLVRAYPAFVHTRFAQVKDIPKNGSSVIKFRRYTNLSAATTALTEGVTPAGSQLAKTDVTATVLAYGDYVTITDFLTFTTLDPVLNETSNLLGDQLGDTLDQLCRDVIVAGSTVQYASTATTRATVAAGMILNAAEVREMVRTMKGNNAKMVNSQVNPGTGYNTSPIRASFIGIISHNTEFDLKSDPDYVPVSEYAQPGSALENEVGAIDEVRFILAGSNAKTFSSTVTVHATLIIGREAYATSRISGEAVRMITKPLGSAGSADPIDQRQTSGWKATFVSVILNQNFMGRIEHAVSS